MRSIHLALFAVTLAAAAPAAAQDWERVFSETATVDGDHMVLVLDPSQPRESADRYKLVALADLLAGVVDFGCRHVAAKPSAETGAFTAADFAPGNTGCGIRAGVRVPDPGPGVVWGRVAAAVPAGDAAPYLGYAPTTGNPGINQVDLFIEQPTGVTLAGDAYDVWVVRVSTLQHRGQAIYFSPGADPPR